MCARREFTRSKRCFDEQNWNSDGMICGWVALVLVRSLECEGGTRLYESRRPGLTPGKDICLRSGLRQGCPVLNLFFYFAPSVGFSLYHDRLERISSGERMQGQTTHDGMITDDSENIAS